MAVNDKKPNLNPMDRHILDKLSEGRQTPGSIAEDSDYSKDYAQNRVRWLVELGYVRNVSRGLYELVEDPREERNDSE